MTGYLRPHLRTSGLSLLELLVAMGISSILLMTALPQMHDTFARHRLDEATRSLSRALHLARQAALLMGTPVTLCPSDDRTTCGNSAYWSSGWLAIPPPSGQSPSPAALAADTLPDGIHVTVSSGRQMIRYQPDGRSTGSNATFTLCSRHRWQRQIIINNAGRFRATAAIRTSC